MKTSRLIDDLLLPVAMKCHAFVARCNHAGIEILVYCTYRDGEAQHELFKHGREDDKSIVTNADAGQSFHQYKVAFDWVPVVNGKPQWNDDVLYNQCGEIAESFGLEWAGRWKGSLHEKAHCQYTNGLTLADFQSGKTLP